MTRTMSVSNFGSFEHFLLGSVTHTVPLLVSVELYMPSFAHIGAHAGEHITVAIIITFTCHVRNFIQMFSGYTVMQLSLCGFSCLPLELFELLLVKSVVILTVYLFKVTSTPHPEVFRVLAAVSASWRCALNQRCVLRMLKTYLAGMYFIMMLNVTQMNVTKQIPKPSFLRHAEVKWHRFLVEK
jgi:hypothetical protein